MLESVVVVASYVFLVDVVSESAKDVLTSAYSVMPVAIVVCCEVWLSLGRARIDRMTVSIEDCWPDLVYLCYGEDVKLYELENCKSQDVFH
jgi:hypothetical protein